jgi:hypothetical protein
MPAAKKIVHENCPFAERAHATDGSVPHIEGRFSALETEVSALKAGLDSMQTEVAEGFKAVFTKIDAISSGRSAATLPWVGTMLVIISMAGALVYNVLSGQKTDIHDLKEVMVQELKDVNARLYTSQFDKGLATAQTAEFTNKLKELDTKLQNETKMTAERIAEQIRSLDEKLQIESRLVAATNRQQMDEQASYAAEMRAWRLKHAEETAYFRGFQDCDSSKTNEKLNQTERRQFEDRINRIERQDPPKVSRNLTGKP